MISFDIGRTRVSIGFSFLLFNAIMFLAAALSIHGAVGDFAMLNLAAGLYNLLPFRQLDGGALVDIFITGTVHEREWRGVLLAVRIIIVLAGAAVFCLWA